MAVNFTAELAAARLMAIIRGTDAAAVTPAVVESIPDAARRGLPVAIGLARLGHRAAWVGRVGTEELGEYVLRQLRAEGVRADDVTRDAERPTGLMFLEQRTADLTRV